MLKLIRVLFFAGVCMGGFVLPALAGNNSGQAFSTWPDTGQTKCYNDTVEIPCPAEGAPFYGQDAQYNVPARSYTDLGNGTVQDNVTGLIWEQKTNKNGAANYTDPHDADNTYTWCDTDPNTNGGNAGTCGANDTMVFLAALNAANYGGHNDWRLPTIKELTTLDDSGRVDLVIDPVFTATTQSDYYWSSTTYAGGTNIAWLVHFYQGVGYSDSKSISHYVRAVRGGQTPPVLNQFVDNGDTVTDTVTGLEWQKATAGPLNWQAALAYCENLTLAGKSDWRLPDRNELRSLVDYSRVNPAIDPILAATTQLFYYWSSTTYASGTSSGWLVYFDIGFAFGGNKSSSYYVRAVRGGQSGLLNPIQRVTSDGLSNYGPHFNHNGSKLTFFSSKAGNNGEIYVINADGTGETRLTNDLNRDYQPHFSPDGTKIVYKSVHGGNSNIWVMNADGSDPHQVTFDIYGEDPTSGLTTNGADWNPDGSKIVFDSMRSGNYEIWIMNADGSNQIQLTAGTSHQTHPNFNQDGSHIAFESDQSGVREIWAMNANGSTKTQLTYFGSGSSYHPHFNHDGTKIGFRLDNKTYLMNADGTGLQEFPYDVNASAAVDWSPDGTKLAYMALGDIWIYSGDMTSPTSSASLSGGTYNTIQTVTLTANEPATIYYTTDGSTPTASSSVYGNSPISIASTTTLKFFAKDTAGNQSSVQTAIYAIVSGDTTPPTGTISINSGAPTTNGTSVTLTLSASDNSGTVSQMRFSNDGASWSTWEAYGTSKSWSLNSSTGTKTVFIQFRDAAGNIATVNDTILYEAAQTPTITTGQNVVIAPIPQVQLTFPTVTTAGSATVTVQASPSPPSNFRVLTGSSYQIVATGGFTFPITVCMGYSDSALADSRNEGGIKLYHNNGTSWEDITTSVDTVNNRVCGLTYSLSPFILVEPTTIAPATKVPVMNGLWLVPAVLMGIGVMRKRRKS